MEGLAEIPGKPPQPEVSSLLMGVLKTNGKWQFGVQDLVTPDDNAGGFGVVPSIKTLLLFVSVYFIYIFA